MSTKEQTTFIKAVAQIRDDIDELLYNLQTVQSEKDAMGLVLEANFVINAWGISARAFEACLLKFKNGDEFNAQDELLNQCVLLKEKEIGNEKKNFKPCPKCGQVVSSLYQECYSCGSNMSV